MNNHNRPFSIFWSRFSLDPMSKGLMRKRLLLDSNGKHFLCVSVDYKEVILSVYFYYWTVVPFRMFRSLLKTSSPDVVSS